MIMNEYERQNASSLVFCMIILNKIVPWPTVQILKQPKWKILTKRTYLAFVDCKLQCIQSVEDMELVGDGGSKEHVVGVRG